MSSCRSLILPIRRVLPANSRAGSFWPDSGDAVELGRSSSQITAAVTAAPKRRIRRAALHARRVDPAAERRNSPSCATLRQVRGTPRRSLLGPVSRTTEPPPTGRDRLQFWAPLRPPSHVKQRITRRIGAPETEVAVFWFRRCLQLHSDARAVGPFNGRHYIPPPTALRPSDGVSGRMQG